MVPETSSHSTSGSMPPKRVLFNRPSWSKPQALTNGNDLFHRSNQTYVDLAAEAERQRKKKLARKEKERARQAEVEERAGKRQRVSASEDDDDDSTSDESSHKSEGEGVNTSFRKDEVRNDVPPSSPPKPDFSPKSLLKRYEATVAAGKLDRDQKQRSPVSHIIDLEDEDDGGPIEILDDSATSRATFAKHSVSSLKEDEVLSDDEFPELARQAREKARRKRLEEDVTSVTPDSPSTLQKDYRELSQTTNQPAPPPPPPDPVLDILITSNIPNTEPLIVKRKLSQRLKDVKLAWAARQHLSPDFTESVFLTWRGKRIFDHTTCRSLGYKCSPNGRIMAGRDSAMDDEGRVHMEVMTRGLYEAHKEAKVNGLLEEGIERNEDHAVEEQIQEAQIKIICKAKGFPDFKLIVKRSTIISKICNAFRTQNKIGMEKDVYLMFDGERLSSDSKVGDTELCDMDTLDVFVK